MLFVIIVAGMIFQIYRGYYNFEIGQYLYELFALQFIHFAIWALLALFIQTLVGNAYLGLFILLIISIGIPFLGLAGIEQSIFKYNQGPGYSYSDMNGYGAFFSRYFTYKLYWLLGGFVLLVVSALFWVRGLPHSFKERLSIAKSRFKGAYLIGLECF